MSYDPTNTHQGCTEKLQNEIDAISRKSESTGSISFTLDEWKNMRTIMRSLCWGNNEAMSAWIKIVKSVDSRMK